MPEKTPIVYVVQDNGRLNFSAAKVHGQLRTLLPPLMNIQIGSTEVSAHLKTALLGFKKEDCILAVGDPAAIVLACAWAAYYTHGDVDVLKFDRQTSTYYKVTLNIPFAAEKK